MSAGGADNRDWDAATYDRVSDPQLRWAREQLARLALRGDETVLDAGCGSGRVTEELAALVPRGTVYAVDVAPSMAAHAQERLGARATVLCQDLAELSLPEQVDAIFSNATFHWIPDHPRLFARLFATLKPGGRLVAQCGGLGNIDAFRVLAEEVAHAEPYARYFATWSKPWNYAGPGETSVRLAAAGFTDVDCWLEPKTVTLEEPRAFVQTVCLVRHLDALPEGELRESFIDRVLAESGHPLVLEYVRLNMAGRRPA